MTREQMLDSVIKRYGFEDEITLQFAEIIETWISDKAVNDMYEIAMKAYLFREQAFYIERVVC